MIAADAPLRAIAESVSDGIIVAGTDSRIELFSAGAERMFGWRADEMVGEELMRLMPERYRALHVAGMRRLEQTGRALLLGEGPVELHGLRRDGAEFPIELALGRWGEPGDSRYVGIIRDVSERHDAERYRRAQLGVAAAVAQAATLEEAADGVLHAMADALGWSLGALWLVDDADEKLELAALWHAPERPVPEFARLSREVSFPRGTGLPGRTWSSGEPQWIEDVLRDENFPRVQAAATEGLHGAVGLPLRADGRVIGVLELFNHELRRPRPSSLALMAAMTDQAAQFLQRKRAEGRLAAASLRERQAGQINEHIIEGLVQATQALDAGDTRGAQRALQETLRHASRIITELRVPRA